MRGVQIRPWNRSNADIAQMAQVDFAAYDQPWNRPTIASFLRQRCHGAILATCAYTVSTEDIEHLAYRLWIAQGEPSNTADVDWKRAEENLNLHHADTVIGQAYYEYVERDPDTWTVDIWGLAVLPQLRRHGVGSAIIGKMLRMRNRCRDIECIVTVENTAANDFLRKNGFRAGEILREFYERTGEDAVRMQRQKAC